MITIETDQRDDPTDQYSQVGTTVTDECVSSIGVAKRESKKFNLPNDDLFSRRTTGRQRYML